MNVLGPVIINHTNDFWFAAHESETDFLCPKLEKALIFEDPVFCNMFEDMLFRALSKWGMFGLYIHEDMGMYFLKTDNIYEDISLIEQGIQPDLNTFVHFELMDGEMTRFK